MRKIYIIPNFVTTANMFCGFYSTISAIHMEFVGAAWAIVVAGIFDSLDGRIARLAKATSQFGVEYDSLCFMNGHWLPISV
jgi:CDP-diacylglycerol--serine O-phosphatidyltransferase